MTPKSYDFHRPAALAIALSIAFALQIGAQITGTRVGGVPPYGNPVLGDVNGDGFDDIVGVDTGTGTGDVWLNQGDGAPGTPPTFLATGQSLPVNGISGNPNLVGRFADINGDGHVDLFAVPLPYFGDGTGTLAASTQTPLAGANGFVPSMDLVDLNNDGHLDAVTFDRSAGPYIFENDGTGVFDLVHTVTGLNAGDGFTQAQAVDFNGDSYLDLLVDGSRSRDFYVLLNDGSNAFSIHFQAAASQGTGSGAADMDGDGHVDVVQGTRTFFGDGAASPTFTEVSGTATHLALTFLHDLDFDGFPDSVRSSWTFLNDGAGLLTTANQIPYSNGTGNKWMDIGDLIGDGTPEIVSTYAANGGNIVMFTGITPPANACLGVDVTSILCYNQTQRRIASPTPASPFDCEDAGLPVATGDKIIVYCYGTANGSEPVGGSMIGVSSVDYLRCTNLSTGQRAYPARVSPWDCEAAGLAVTTGQSIRMTTIGTAD